MGVPTGNAIPRGTPTATPERLVTRYFSINRHSR